MTYVLIHGAGDVAWYWHLVAAQLRERGHEVVAVDLPCEDESAGWSDYADSVVEGEHEVQAVLQEKRTFLRELERRILIAASGAKSVGQVTREVFRNSGFITKASLGEGWLSLLTASDFSRSHLVESFLRRRLPSTVGDGV